MGWKFIVTQLPQNNIRLNVCTFWNDRPLYTLYINICKIIEPPVNHTLIDKCASYCQRPFVDKTHWLMRGEGMANSQLKPLTRNIDLIARPQWLCGAKIYLIYVFSQKLTVFILRILVIWICIIGTNETRPCVCVVILVMRCSSLKSLMNFTVWGACKV